MMTQDIILNVDGLCDHADALDAAANRAFRYATRKEEFETANLLRSAAACVRGAARQLHDLERG